MGEDADAIAASASAPETKASQRKANGVVEIGMPTVGDEASWARSLLESVRSEQGRLESKMAEFFKRSGESTRMSLQRVEQKVTSQSIRISELSGTVQGLSEESQRQLHRAEASEQRVLEFGQHLEELIHVNALIQKDKASSNASAMSPEDAEQRWHRRFQEWLEGPAEDLVRQHCSRFVQEIRPAVEEDFRVMLRALEDKLDTHLVDSARRFEELGADGARAGSARAGVCASPRAGDGDTVQRASSPERVEAVSAAAAAAASAAKAEEHLMYGLEDVMMKVEQLDSQVQTLRRLSERDEPLRRLSTTAWMKNLIEGGAQARLPEAPRSPDSPAAAVSQAEARLSQLETSFEETSGRIAELSSRTAALDEAVVWLRQRAASATHAGTDAEGATGAGSGDSAAFNALRATPGELRLGEIGVEPPMASTADGLLSKWTTDNSSWRGIASTRARELARLRDRIEVGETECAYVQEQIRGRMAVMDRLIRLVSQHTLDSGEPCDLQLGCEKG